MKFVSAFVVISAFVGGSAGLVSASTTNAYASAVSADSPEEEVKATIRKMIALIDSRKTLELLEKYTDVPADQREKLAGRIEPEKLDEMKTFLGKAAKLSPKVSDDSKSVVFESDDFPRPMVFVKSGDRWIMKDKR